MQLRPYQSDVIARTRQALRHHRRVLVQLPTGGGKTVISAFMIAGAAERGLPTWFVVHRRELLDQTSRTLEACGVPHGFCAAGFPPRYREPVTLCSVQTLARRAERLKPPGLIVWDESHHCAAGTWRGVADRFPEAVHIGLTATPERLDGKGLDGMFSALIPGPSVAWLIDNGFLCPPRVWTQPAPDLSGVADRGTDFDAGDLAAIMSERRIVGDAVEHYQRLCGGARAVAFCCSVDHALTVRDAFRAAGIASEELDGTADARTRRDVVRAFRAGDIQVLTSVDLFGEGFDLPELTASILLRPTKSLGLYLQQVGRCLRPAPGKTHAIILDHAGNVGRHGPPDQDREWSLAGRKRRAGTARVRTCPNCFGCCAVGCAVCPYCGTPFESAGGRGDLTAEDGSLIEVDFTALRAAAARATSHAEFEGICARAKTLAELRALAKARGYHWKWADHRWAHRAGRAASVLEQANAG